MAIAGKIGVPKLKIWWGSVAFAPNVVSREVNAVGSFDDLFGRGVSGLVSDTMIARRLSTKTMLTGMHAFLMALEESGPADTFEVAVLGTLAFVGK
jgi:hypothetical protein